MSRINSRPPSSTLMCGCKFSISSSKFPFSAFTAELSLHAPSCRRLDDNFNIFEGMFRNYWFLGIQTIIIVCQILIVLFGGAAFSVKKLNGAQWGYSLVLGALSIPVGTIIRLLPDELFLPFGKLVPDFAKGKRTGPVLFVEDDDRLQQWNPALEEIREELTFLKKIRGGRMSELAYKLQHPIDSYLPRSHSGSRSRSRSNSDLPRTPPNGEQSVAEPTTSSPQTPEKSRRRARSTSNSVFGPAAMAGIIAGSIAGGWSPTGRRSTEQDTIRFNPSSPYSGLNELAGVEVHPDTRPDDPVIVENPMSSSVPPSQNPALTPYFEHGPNNSPRSRPHRSHSRQSSSKNG